MNNGHTNKTNNKIPVPMPQQQRQLTREDYINHPEFMPLFTARMEAVSTEGIEIPDEFDAWLKNSLSNISIPDLQMPNDSLDILFNSNAADMPFGVFQKAVNIIWMSWPENNCIYVREFYNYVWKPVNAMRQQIIDIVEPVKQSVIDELIKKTAPSIIKQS